MGYRLIRNVVSPTQFGDFPHNEQQLDLTIRLPHDPRKVICGTVVDDQTSLPVPCAIVKFFRANSGDPRFTCDLTPIGHAITDDCGHFLAGPFEPPFTIVWKVFKLVSDNYSTTATNFVSTYPPIDAPPTGTP